MGKALTAPETVATPARARERLVEALRLDLVGPGPDDTAHHEEVLPRPPSRWYLTGYLVPHTTPDDPEVRKEVEARQEELKGEEDLESPVDDPGAEDSGPAERTPPRAPLGPSSIGLTVLLDSRAETVRVTVEWGDYVPLAEEDIDRLVEERPSLAAWLNGEKEAWLRRHRRETIEVPVGNRRHPVTADGLCLEVVGRETELPNGEGGQSARSLTLFLVNDRHPRRPLDLGYAFQAVITVESEHLIGRHDATGIDAEDYDARVADLHYADVAEWAVGHGVGIERLPDGPDGVLRVRTTWLPQARVERVVPETGIAAELRMQELGQLETPNVRSALLPLTEDYGRWIGEQEEKLVALSGRRLETARQLLEEAERARRRIEAGIELLARDGRALEAFRIANRAVFEAASRRRARESGRSVEAWRPFQLAFLLLNLPALADPSHSERETVDLLFFPTGGGKTEAYLGLAAFAMVHRRLLHGEPRGLGLSVLMRYTLRLLTLDQLSRAAGVVCALELERRRDPEKLGRWPFEIGLWVGRAATPNRMGGPGDQDENCAYHRLMRFKKKGGEPPVPLDSCPWCGTPFDSQFSFQLVRDGSKPVDLRLRCVNGNCEFEGTESDLPILTVDESIYRRVPAFLVATVDKFAALPWTGETSTLFGRVADFDPKKGADPLPPKSDAEAVFAAPDLVIQDELHLISGPLGTMVGLFETAIDALASREADGRRIRPKIVASTATVRRAEDQVRRLFARRRTALFPPPGIDRRDSFFARALPPEEDPGARLYVGLAAPMRGAKALFLRATSCLLAAASATRTELGEKAADPFLTLVGYFNALRELGAARRIVEGEVGPFLEAYDTRRHPDTGLPLLAAHEIGDPLELTSRVGIADVAEAKRRLSSEHREDGAVDVVLATNMISVGLDIPRLGLMEVAGQPKSTAEYIQATSRIGRVPARPGLVVVLLNLAKPRDRSHYEHFPYYHATFYRSVEATSVTPFSEPALDRGLAALVVALARHGNPDLWPEQKADNLDGLEAIAGRIEAAIAERSKSTGHAELEPVVRERIRRLVEAWRTIVRRRKALGGNLSYSERTQGVERLLRDMLEPLDPGSFEALFRAPRSMRDVEPAVWLEIRDPWGHKLGGGS